MSDDKRKAIAAELKHVRDKLDKENLPESTVANIVASCNDTLNELLGIEDDGSFLDSGN